MNFNLLNDELNPICHLLALLGAHRFFHVSGLRVKTHFSCYFSIVYYPYILFLPGHQQSCPPSTLIIHSDPLNTHYYAIATSCQTPSHISPLRTPVRATLPHIGKDYTLCSTVLPCRLK